MPSHLQEGIFLTCYFSFDLGGQWSLSCFQSSLKFNRTSNKNDVPWSLCVCVWVCSHLFKKVKSFPRSGFNIHPAFFFSLLGTGLISLFSPETWILLQLPAPWLTCAGSPRVWEKQVPGWWIGVPRKVLRHDHPLWEMGLKFDTSTIFPLCNENFIFHQLAK